MQTTNILQSDYTLCKDNYQLLLPLNIEYMIPTDDSVRLLSRFVEEMNLSDLYATYSRFRENQATPRQMLKIIIYAYMNRCYSSRDIETKCHRDINFMYLLQGRPAPDHATIARFRSMHLSVCATNVMTEVSNFLYSIGEISGDAVFIDGTKIEAAANKYTFVWKKAVTKNEKKLLEKLAAFIAECEEMYEIKVGYGTRLRIRNLKKLKRKLYTIKSEESITFVHGIGRRKSQIQKSIEYLEESILRLNDYAKKKHICGERNSFSKTDHDATFMRMKEDAMLNGQLKPAYNLQHGVDSGYITWMTIGSQPTDTTTLIPFLTEMEHHLSFKYTKIVADAGYESEENYSFIEKNGQFSFIKPSNYEISKTRKFQNDISRIENMDYNADEDYYLCKNEKKLSRTGIKTRKTKTGYLRESTIYECDNCSGCPFRTNCIKGNNSKISLDQRTKHLEVSKTFITQRKADLERILSPEGTELRMNRSIQAEGSFGELKADMEFRRFLSRGKANVLTESILLGMAQNMLRLHHKIQSGKTGLHLYPLKKGA